MNNNEIDNEFIEIEKGKSKNYIIVVAILYVIVIILTIILIFGIKNQKDALKNSNQYNNSNEINKVNK